jgi:hypothetical protein
MHGLWLAAWLLAAVPAGAEVVSPGPDAVAVTIYRDHATETQHVVEQLDDPYGFAMVTETRTVDLPAGRSRLVFKGVSDGLMPQTAKLEGLPGGVVEQNFEYDLLTPKALFARSIGRTVRLIRTNPATGETTEVRAIVRSGPDEAVLEIDGRIEPLRCSGLAERIVFDQVPEGLAASPTLSLVVDAPSAGRRTVKLSYLSKGFDWSADYVANVRPDGRTLDLSGWMTLVNGNTTGFANAPVQVIGGRLNRIRDYEWEPDPPTPKPCRWFVEWVKLQGVTRVEDLLNALPQTYADEGTEVSELVVTGSRIPDTRQIGDYKLFALPEPTTVAPRQVKQVVLLEQKGAGFERYYSYAVRTDDLEEGPRDEQAEVVIRLKNDKASNLGVPLPSGIVAVIETAPNGRSVLIGEARIHDTPVGMPFEIGLAGAPDVRVGTRLLSKTEVPVKKAPRKVRDENDPETEYEDTPDPRWRYELEVVVSNGKAEAIEFELLHGVEPGYRMLRESRRHQIRYGAPAWILRLEPGGREVVRYTIEQAY